MSTRPRAGVCGPPVATYFFYGLHTATMYEIHIINVIIKVIVLQCALRHLINAVDAHLRDGDDGTSASITGNLTLNGVTNPVTIDARFTGAGTNPMNKAETIGFEGTTTIQRSDFGVDYAVPMVSDEVMLKITVAFEKQ